MPHITCLPYMLTRDGLDDVTSVLLRKYNLSQQYDVVITDSSVSMTFGSNVLQIDKNMLSPYLPLSLNFKNNEP